MGNAVKKVIKSLLIICFLITDISPAFAQEQNQIALDPAQFTTVDSDKFMQNPDQLSKEDVADLRKFLDLPTQTTQEILFLLKNLYHRVKMEEEKLGTEAVTKILSRRKDSQSIDFEVENLGKAEPLVINTKRGPLFFTKVRHNKLKMTLLFIDKSQIDIQFLEESERRVKLGLTELDPTLQGLSEKQIKLELDHRKFILKHMRTLYAKMLMSEWNPKLEYVPLSDQVEQANKESETLPDELKSRVAEVTEQPFSELKHKPWFQKLASKTFNTWMDLAKQEEVAKNTSAGNEALMLMMFDSQQNSRVDQNTLNKPSKFSLGYWKTWWQGIYEKPSYGEAVWKNNKGIGKLKVLLTGDYLVGLGFGVSLGLISSATALLFPGSLPMGLDTLDVGLISFGYSLFFGVFGKTWANFIYRGSEFQRFIKNWGPGIAQSYTYNLFSSESLAMIRSDGKFDLNAIKMHADIVINQSVKTVTKTSLQKIPKIRDKTGEAEGTMKIPYYKIVLPWKHNMKFLEIEATETTIDTLKYLKWIKNQFTINESTRSWEEKFIIKFHRDWKISAPWLVRQEYETYIPRKNFENQAIQFITTPIGLLSRFGFMIGPIPVGHLLYMLLGPIGEVRYIRYLRDYADILTQNYGEKHALTKRVRAEVVKEITDWNNLRIGNLGKIEFYKNPTPEPGVVTIMGYEPRVLSKEELLEETLHGRGDKPKPAFAIPNATQFFGYYVISVPIEIWEASKNIAKWVARKTAYYTYNVYQGIEKDFKAQEINRAEATAAQERYKLLMTVQSGNNGKPHPKQIENGIRFYRAGACGSLFQ